MNWRRTNLVCHNAYPRHLTVMMILGKIIGQDHSVRASSQYVQLTNFSHSSVGVATKTKPSPNSCPVGRLSLQFLNPNSLMLSFLKPNKTGCFSKIYRQLNCWQISSWQFLRKSIWNGLQNHHLKTCNG